MADNPTVVLPLLFYAFPSAFRRYFLFHEMFGRRNVAYVRAAYGENCPTRDRRKNRRPSVLLMTCFKKHAKIRFRERFGRISLQWHCTGFSVTRTAFENRINRNPIGQSETVAFSGTSNQYVSDGIFRSVRVRNTIEPVSDERCLDI